MLFIIAIIVIFYEYISKADTNLAKTAEYCRSQIGTTQFIRIEVISIIKQ